MPFFPSLKSPLATDGVDPTAMEITQAEARAEPGTGLTTVNTDEEDLKQPVVKLDLAAEGAKRSELMQVVWGRHGRLLIFIGICVFMVVYELDNYTFSTYYVYAISSFMQTSQEAALTTASNLTFSLLKPVWSKMSDVWGRGTMYPVALVLALVGMIVAASAKSFEAFAAGTVLRVVGITAFNSLNTIVISDLTSTRLRGFGVNIQFFPTLVLPWCISYMVSAVVSPGGIGWGWGIGIIAIILPFGTAMITAVLLIYERRAKRLEVGDLAKPKPTFSEVVSSMDLLGVAIIIVGCAFILIPLSLASNQPHGYKTPWVIALMVIGGLMLIGLPFFEAHFAAHPFLPMRYLKHRSICLGFLLYFTDYMAAAASHNYLYNWAVIAKNMSIVTATNLSNVNGVMIFTMGIILGAILYKTRHFKWILMGGVALRLLGYGLMFRVRTSHPSTAEIFVVQFIQGIGDGIVQSGGYVAATINVPHRETAQMAALVVTIGMLGQSVGTAICGAIYTGTMREQLSKALGSDATPELISNLYNSITTGVPDWGTPQRAAIAVAVSLTKGSSIGLLLTGGQYNKVTSYFFIAAMAMIIPGIAFALFIPNQTLNDNQNLVEDAGMLGQKMDTVTEIPEQTSSAQRENVESKKA
ncbi:hypothetical protein A1O1_01454 [Capronia coronata CBS 617.96]|uniref:Major facilitator superfamily (MFS) profile domain-containing protein n=1 Tax=Capronia coronata CBS 617.96 TaxID=1182541 RepID=W9YV08_9EURO|nr:uncharacterized protein A1O1_01454 [Capronia coronata CBS 617.96]EXJ96328.1 hypothetical protein A1O1_01454 [Capronia coronata CBS 617.96]